MSPFVGWLVLFVSRITGKKRELNRFLAELDGRIGQERPILFCGPFHRFLRDSFVDVDGKQSGTSR